MYLKGLGLISLLLLLVFLPGCSQTTPTSIPTPTNQTSDPSSVSTSEAYPQPAPPQTKSPLQAYPPPTSLPSAEIQLDPYPSPESGQIVAGGPPFELKKPIFTGSDTINGTGPAGVPIAILDVTSMGEFLGQGVIDSGGKFSITIIPVDKGHRIGIILGNLEGSPWQPENFYSDGYFGENALQIPLVGFMFDTALVRDE